MTHKLLAAALGILVLVPHTTFAQDARVPDFSIKRLQPPLTQGKTPRLQPWGGASSKDTNTNGAVIGAAIGAAAGALGGLAWASIDENSDSIAGPVLGMMVLGAAGGAGVGWGIDNMRRSVSYPIRVSRNVSIEPSVGLDKRPGQAAAGVRAGLGASFGW